MFHSKVRKSGLTREKLRLIWECNNFLKKAAIFRPRVTKKLDHNNQERGSGDEKSYNNRV